MSVGKVDSAQDEGDRTSNRNIIASYGNAASLFSAHNSVMKPVLLGARPDHNLPCEVKPTTSSSLMVSLVKLALMGA